MRPNVLKPALSRGEIQCIGATTLDEYRKYIEKDAALERPLSADHCRRTVLRRDGGDSGRFARSLRSTPSCAIYRCRFATEAAKLSSRYITVRVQPDKSIDVLDEAGARIRLRNMTKPSNLTEMEKDIERLMMEKDEAVKNADYERAAELRDKAEKMRATMEETQNAWKDRANEFDGIVDDEVIAEVVSKMTGIPLTKLEKDESSRLLSLEEELSRRVISQEEAIKAVARSVRRSRSGLKDPNRPMGSFIFVGPERCGQDIPGQVLD